jgi:choline-sulfatase
MGGRNGSESVAAFLGMRKDHFRDEDHIRIAIAAYYGMVSFLDDNIGRVLKTLAEAGIEDDTLVIYTSDHLGARRFWGKPNM